MLKTLLATIGAVSFAASALQAAPGHSFGGGRGYADRPAARAGYAYRGGHYGYRGGYGYHRYYLFGVPYFYDPFFFGYYGGFYGGGYGYGGYGYGGDPGYGYNNGAYDGRVVDDRNRGNDGNQPDPAEFAKAVQRQLSRRGYYKGAIDGEFGAGSKSALTRFQQDNNLRATGRIDPATLKVLGFEDREQNRDRDQDRDRN